MQLSARRSSLAAVQHYFSITEEDAADSPDGETVRIPLTSGIAGAAAATGKVVRVADAYADPRFNPEVDRLTGFRTRSMLCLPLHDRDGNVFAVTQLLNRRDGEPFDDRDERRYAEFATSLAVLLESLVGMGAAARRVES